MDSTGLPLVIGKRYNVDGFNNVQYIGLEKTKRGYMFELVSPNNRRAVFVRYQFESPPIPVEDGDETDTEFMDNPYESDGYESEGGRRRRKRAATKRLKRSKRTTKRHRKSSRKHRRRVSARHR